MLRTLRDLRAEYLALRSFYGEREAREIQPFGAIVDAVAVGCSNFARWANRHPTVSICVIIVVTFVLLSALDG
jgi:hypothetical protein